MIRFTVPGRPVPLPRTTQRKKWADPSWRRYLEWRDAVAWAAKVAGAKPLAGEVELRATFVMGDRRRSDLDNCIKGLCDALTGVAWKDDVQVRRIMGQIIRGPSDEPRTIVQIESLEEEASA